MTASVQEINTSKELLQRSFSKSNSSKLLVKVLSSLTLSIICSISTLAQELQFKKIDKAYTWRTATKSQIDSFYYNLTPSEHSKMQIHYRISWTGQVVDLLSDDGVNYSGILTNMTTEYALEKVSGQSHKQSTEKQEIFQRIMLDETLVKNVVDSLLASKLIEWPTDSLISTWNMNFLHGEQIHFDYKIDQQFKTLEYDCPWAQNDSVPYKKEVMSNYNFIKSSFLVDSLYGSFVNKLPKGKRYSKDGYRMMYKLTEKEIEYWERGKPRRDYLASIKDTVDNYIITSLKKKNIELIGIDCFEEFGLVFGKNGKLKDVKVFKNDRPTLISSYGIRDFLDAKKELRSCKKTIKEMFRHIELDFLSLEYEVYRTLSFDVKGEFQLRDWN